MNLKPKEYRCRNSHKMKIRIKENSIRLRLTKSEVETFCKEGNYSETTVIGNRSLTYALVAKEDIAMLEADFEGNIITVYITIKAKETWFDSDIISYSNRENISANGELAILVEKDFTCMDETIEDQSDNYPNPKQ